MKEVLKDLTKKQIKFICQECNITKDELFAMDDDTLYDKVYDVMCDIEIAETPSSDDPLTEHCKMASDLVTVLGNTLAVYDPEIDGEDFLVITVIGYPNEPLFP